MSLGVVREHAAIEYLCARARLAEQALWPREAWPLGPVPTTTLTAHFGTAADFGDPQLPAPTATRVQALTDSWAPKAAQATGIRAGDDPRSRGLC